MDLAVAAIEALRAGKRRHFIAHRGAVDADNPEHVNEAELARWRATEGVELIGRAEDINAFWAGVHIACLPSRGGEGLPRLLLEAAACARRLSPPTCRGALISSATAKPALSLRPTTSQRWRRPSPRWRAMAHCASAWALRAARVVGGYTERHAADVAARAWRAVLR
ncbi:MAG: hypothetical protein R3C16_10990 [Hyphomonadaceae bacterium]